ncbi:YncE family protein [Kordia algicida OT-1]|uniref:Surface antigen genes (Methanosarcina mazei) related protein n=1 Tax=Kordia algicida OT-1 TaxID=391587 RepID=A9DWB0_9FLAO|nr:YncE family protein [Kordia algicida]EDP96534.1 surface antigen genes (Methanosarcina mazei) related protein [Kordia algicida OT-1]
MSKQLYNWYDRNERLRSFYKELLEENQVAQITVTNCSAQQREITLWGANKCAPIADPLYGSEQVKLEADVDRDSYEVIYNPVNDLFYVINYRDDTITVVDDQAQVVQTIALHTDVILTVNPISMVVNTNPNSAEYGCVAIVGTSGKEFIVVDLTFTVLRRIQLVNEPYDLGYDPVLDCYYISEPFRNLILKITTLDDQIIEHLTIEGLRNIGINTDNGDLYVHNVVNNDVEVYNTAGNKRGWFERVTTNENHVSFYYHPISKYMYIGYDTLNSVLVADGQTLAVQTTLNTGSSPIDIHYNPQDTYIYVANQTDQDFTRIDEDLQVVDTLAIVAFDRSFAISSKNGAIALNNSTLQQLFIYTRVSKLLVKVNQDYEQIRQDFKYNPMIITHMKVVASTNQRINTLQIIETSISGKQLCEPISLGGYHSPQGFGNVSEVFEMEGQIVDGRVCWRFKINPDQQVTFLIYYKQLEMYNFLPEKSSVSTGVAQSKGIPKAWKKEH